MSGAASALVVDEDAAASLGLDMDQRGLSLVEQLISLALLGILVVTLLYALSGGTVAVGVVDEQVTSLNLATSALESVRGMAYVTGTAAYTPALNVPPGYEVTVASSVAVSLLPSPSVTVAVKTLTWLPG